MAQVPRYLQAQFQIHNMESVQKSQRVRISKKLTTEVPEIVAPNFEKRILKLKEEMATLEMQGSNESKTKTAVFDNKNESSSTHKDHHQDEFEYDHFDYSDSESEYESDSGDDYEEHRIDMVQGNPQTNRKYHRGGTGAVHSRLVLGANTLSPTEVGALSVVAHPDFEQCLSLLTSLGLHCRC